MLVDRDAGPDLRDPRQVDLGKGQARLAAHLEQYVAPGVDHQRMTVSFPPVLVLAGLSLVVYLGGSRRKDPGRPRTLTFDDAQVYPLAGRSAEEVPEPEPPHVEPAITHPVSAESGALDRLLAGVQLPCGLERLHPAGEDETILPAHDQLRAQFPDLLTILIPRHTARGADLEMLCGDRACRRRSAGGRITSQTGVTLPE